MSKELNQYETYKKDLHNLRIELSKLSYHIIKKKMRVCVLLEGRDVAGKDGTIKRMLKYLPSRQTRMIALDKPSERETKSWYFQRYIPYLPVKGELVFFNRSWYNRSIVEPVMSFCTQKEYTHFIQQITQFEQLLIQEGFILIKYWLEIDKETQKKRLEERKTNILKQWKLSKIDMQAQSLWKSYTYYRDQMFAHTNHPNANWIVVNFNEKKPARIALIRHFLNCFSYEDQQTDLIQQDDPLLVYPYSEELYEQKRLYS